MKTLSILVEDNMVSIDGIGLLVNCSSLDPTIHAVQWNGDRGRGHIEFVDEDPNDGQRPPNATIDNIEQFMLVVNAWNVLKQELDAKIAAQAAQAAAAAAPLPPSGGMNVLG